jgi:hypothetical protein
VGGSGKTDREKVATENIGSLDEVAWMHEIETRLAKIDAGRAQLLSVEQALAGLHRGAHRGCRHG